MKIVLIAFLFLSSAVWAVTSIFSGLASAQSAGTSLTSGGGGTPAGLATYVQYSDGTAFDAESDFTYNASSNTLTVDNVTTKDNPGTNGIVLRNNDTTTFACSNANSDITLFTDSNLVEDKLYICDDSNTKHEVVSLETNGDLIIEIPSLAPSGYTFTADGDIHTQKIIFNMLNDLAPGNTADYKVAQIWGKHIGGTRAANTMDADLAFRMRLGGGGFEDRLLLDGSGPITFSPNAGAIAAGLAAQDVLFEDDDGTGGLQYATPAVAAIENVTFGMTTITHKTADAILTVAEMRNGLVTCADTSNNCILTLPTLAASRDTTAVGSIVSGISTCFVVTNTAFGIEVNPNDADGIAFNNVTTDGGHLLIDADVGDSLCLMAGTAEFWIVTSTVGTVTRP